MDEMDFIRQQWQQMAERNKKLEDANRILSERLADRKTESLQTRLGRRTIIHGWCGLLLPVLAPLLVFELGFPVWVAVEYGLFGVLMSLMSFLLGDYIRGARLVELPVAEAMARAIKIKMWKKRMNVAGWSLLCVVIASMAFMLPAGPDRTSMVTGGLVGLAIGLVIGIRRSVVDMRMARELLRSLEK